MRASYKKRLTWYGGIFLLGLLVFGVNKMQYDKVKFSYAIEKVTICDEQGFRNKVWEENDYTSMAEQVRLGKFKPITTDMSNKIKNMNEEIKKQYQSCLNEIREGTLEAKSKKERTKFMLGMGVLLMVLTLSFALIDFTIQFYQRSERNKVIVKRMLIIVSIIWVLVAFSINYGYRGLHWDKFVRFGIIPAVIINGLLWAFGSFKPKD